MSLFEELKRRNVFRVGVAYAVAAWVLLQIFDVVGEILDLPNWSGKLILVILVIGFLLALILAWAFELTPEGVKRESEIDRSRAIAPQTGRKLNALILVLMAVAIAYLLFDKLYLSQQLANMRPETAQSTPATPGEGAPPAARTTTAAAIDRRSIAVLPFENRSRLEDDEFFVEGVHDDLLTSLARIGSLKVISRTSVSQYKDTGKTIPQIADELGVATVMEGAVQRSGTTVRINVQLIDAQTDQHLWAEIFDRELTADNLFAIQSEISEKIAAALEATLSPEEQRRLHERPTENLAAYNAFLRGRQLMARRNSEDVDQAAEEFERAVELDPEFALAWVSIAEVSTLQATYSSLDLMDALKRKQMATDRALAIDNRLGEAYASLAALHEFHQRYEDAEAAYLKAIELSPGYANAYMWYAAFLADFPQRLGEALETQQKAAELDPMSSIIQVELADLLVTLGRYADAEAQLTRVLEIDPGFAPAYVSMSEMLSETGRFDEQIAWLNKSIALDPGRMFQYLPLMWAYMDIGHPEGLEDIRQRMAAINEENLVLGWVDMISSMYRGNYEASLEAARWTYERMGRRPMFMGLFAFIYNMQRNYPEARAAAEIAMPGYFDRNTWRSAMEEEPEKGCLAGWLLIQTGDGEMGEDLIHATISYLETELPRYIDHADRYSGAYCYAALGDFDKAMKMIEARFEHRHYGGWWFLRKQPQMEPLWGDPRFEAAMQRVEDDLSVQRANLAQAETAANF